MYRDIIKKKKAGQTHRDVTFQGISPLGSGGNILAKKKFKRYSEQFRLYAEGKQGKYLF